MPEHETSRLILEAPRSGTVAETADYLVAIETCYRHLYVFHEWVDDIVDGEWRRWGPFPWLYPPSAADTVATTEHVLQLGSVQLRSPGFWEFLGALNPLETIRKYLVDRNERRKDSQWREELDAEKQRLDTERLRTQAVAERIDMLRKAGIPQSIIRRALAAHVLQPLGAMDRFQDANLIGGVLTDMPHLPIAPAPPYPAQERRRYKKGEKKAADWKL